MSELVCGLPLGWKIGVMAVYPIFEWWLGRTKKVEACSLIDLILNLFRKGAKNAESI